LLHFLSIYKLEKWSFYGVVFRKTANSHFWTPFGDFGVISNEHVHLSFVGKPVVDFILAIIKLFC